MGLCGVSLPLCKGFFHLYNKPTEVQNLTLEACTTWSEG